MKRLFTALILVLIAAAAFADGMGSGSDSGIVGRWRWESAKFATESVETGDTADNYLLTFNADGTFQVRSDCRTGSGRYTADGSILTMSLASMTTMECETGTFTEAFERLLGEVGSFNYSLDSGTQLSFRFAGGAGAAEFIKTNDAM